MILKLLAPRIPIQIITLKLSAVFSKQYIKRYDHKNQMGLNWTI